VDLVPSILGFDRLKTQHFAQLNSDFERTYFGFSTRSQSTLFELLEIERGSMKLHS
jgi:hypothetical protein